MYKWLRVAQNVRLSMGQWSLPEGEETQTRQGTLPYSGKSSTTVESTLNKGFLANADKVVRRIKTPNTPDKKLADTEKPHSKDIAGWQYNTGSF